MSDGASDAFHALRVARVIDETHDARSFVLEVPESLAGRFAYRAGQFLTFQVPIGAATLGRCYSLSSSPDCDDELVFTVKRVAEGRVSNWFHDALRAGDTLRVSPPAGRFVLRASSQAPLALAGGGSGITPLFSLLKTALATTARPVHLLYANRDARSVIFDAALRELQAAHGARLRVHQHLDSERGFLDAAGARAWLGPLREAEFYLCGPGPFMELVAGELRTAGVAREQVFVERFVSPPDGELPVEPDPSADRAGAAVETPAALTVHLGGATHRVPYAAGQTILAAARAAGLTPPFACEESYCGCCMAKLVEGSVAMAQCHALDDDDRAEGWILPCQAKPTSATCEVRWED